MPGAARRRRTKVGRGAGRVVTSFLDWLEVAARSGRRRDRGAVTAREGVVSPATVLAILRADDVPRRVGDLLPVTKVRALTTGRAGRTRRRPMSHAGPAPLDQAS